MNPTICIKYRKKVFIPSGHVAIWSGEYLHAGASYQVGYRRLIIAFTLEKNSS